MISNTVMHLHTRRPTQQADRKPDLLFNENGRVEREDDHIVWLRRRRPEERLADIGALYAVVSVYLQTAPHLRVRVEVGAVRLAPSKVLVL